MKWLAWAVLILSAAGTYYLLNQGSPRSEKSKETFQEELVPDDEEPREVSSTVDEVIQPTPREDEVAPEGPKKKGKGETSKAKDKKGDGREDGDETGEDRERPERRRRGARQSSSPLPSGIRYSAPSSDAAAGSQATEGTAPSTQGSGLGNVPLAGFSTSGTSSGGSSSSASSPSSSGRSSPPKTGSRRPSPAPSTPSTPTKSSGETTSASHEKAPSSPTAGETPKAAEPQQVTESTTTDPTSQQPALILDPVSVTLDTNPEHSPAQHVISAYSFKSALDPLAKPIVQIFRDCSLTPPPSMTATGCDPAQIPPGGPAVIAYTLGTTLLRNDLDPATKEFEIGTIVVGAYLNPETGQEIQMAEVDFKIDPGVVPGRYVVQIRNQDKTIEALFEVLAPGTTS